MENCHTSFTGRPCPLFSGGARPDSHGFVAANREWLNPWRLPGSSFLPRRIPERSHLDIKVETGRAIMFGFRMFHISSRRRFAFLTFSAVILSLVALLLGCVEKTSSSRDQANVLATGKIIETGRDLGWRAGQDVSREFASVVRRMRRGDTLVLNDMYRIRGSNHQFPDDFTLRATDGGGFSITDAGTNPAPLMRLGQRNTFDNVKITSASSTPDTGYSGNDAAVGVDFAPGATIAAFGADGLNILSSTFEGNVAMLFDLRFVDDVTILDSTFNGGFYQMRWLGAGSNYRVERSVFKNALGDGIKTVQTDGGGIRNVRISDSYFLNNERDGIDTTGGFQNSLISNTIFVGGGLDIKSIIEKPEDVRSAQMNSNITIQGSQFIDTKNAIVTTMLDRAGLMTLSNVENLMPNNITVRNTIFEKTNNDLGDQRAFLIKDGHNITWDNVQLLGGITEMRLMNAQAPDGWAAHSIGGSKVRRGPARPNNAHSWRALAQ